MGTIRCQATINNTVGKKHSVLQCSILDTLISHYIITTCLKLYMLPNTALIHQGTDFTRPLTVCFGICAKSSAAAPARCEVWPPQNGLICPAHPTDGQIDQDLGIWIWRLKCNSSEKTLTCSLHVSLQL